MTFLTGVPKSTPYTTVQPVLGKPFKGQNKDFTCQQLCDLNKDMQEESPPYYTAAQNSRVRTCEHPTPLKVFPNIAKHFKVLLSLLSS